MTLLHQVKHVSTMYPVGIANCDSGKFEGCSGVLRVNIFNFGAEVGRKVVVESGPNTPNSQGHAKNKQANPKGFGCFPVSVLGLVEPL